MQPEHTLEAQEILQLLFSVGQAVVFQHPFSFTFEQEHAAGFLGNIQQCMLIRLGKKNAEAPSPVRSDQTDRDGR
ncbi:hypothetical protein [Pseudomonas sp. LT1P18]|uniref:hypothetical protein n=1 Tax=Pseudomonas arabinosi TaxID=3398357 RepID=UPI0039EEF144